MAKISDQDILSIIDSDSEVFDNCDSTPEAPEQPCSGTVIERATKKVYTVPNLSQHLNPEDRLPFKKNVTSTFFGSDPVVVDILSYNGGIYAGAKAQFQKRQAEEQNLTEAVQTVDFTVLLESAERATSNNANKNKKNKRSSPAKQRKNTKRKKARKNAKTFPEDGNVAILQNRTIEDIVMQNETTGVTQECITPETNKGIKKKNLETSLPATDWLRNKLGQRAKLEASRLMKKVAQSKGLAGLSVGKNGSPLKPSSPRKRLQFETCSSKSVKGSTGKSTANDKKTRETKEPLEIGIRYLIDHLLTEEYIMAHSYYGQRSSLPLSSDDRFGIEMIRDYCEWYLRQYEIPFSELNLVEVYNEYRKNVKHRINSYRRRRSRANP